MLLKTGLAYTVAHLRGLTPGAVGVWTDFDMSSIVPASARGVLIEISDNSSNDGLVGVRCKGDTIDNSFEWITSETVRVAIPITNARIVQTFHAGAPAPNFLIMGWYF
jgi:hypothetical protein